MTKQDKREKLWTSFLDLEEGQSELLSDTLREFGVSPVLSEHPRKQMTILSVKFYGTKCLVDSQEDRISFEWDIKQGLWGLISTSNLVGKSTVINIIQLALTGKNHLQDDVAQWISNASVRVSIDKDCFHFNLSKNEESEWQACIASTKDDITDVVLIKEYRELISSFMIDKLGLHRVNSTHKGKIVQHEWPALSHSLFILESEHKHLFGHTNIANLSGSILQIFGGNQWTGIHSMIRSILVQLKSRLPTSSTPDVNNESESELKLVEYSLDELRSIRKEMSSRNELRYELLLYRNKEETVRDQLGELIKAQRQNIEDPIVQSMFAVMQPTYCPVCTQEIDRLRPNHDNCCILCNKSMPTTSTSNPMEIDTDFNRNLERKRSEMEASLTTIRERIDQVEQRLEQIESTLLDIDISILNEEIESRLVSEERARHKESLAPLNLKRLQEQIRIMTVVEKRLNQLSKTLFDSLSKPLGTYVSSALRTMGMPSVESVELKRNGHAYITKNGARAPFGKLTSGERLRVKISIIVGLIRLSLDLDMGLHPGMLILDNIGNEELNEEDLKTIAHFLLDTCKEYETLQFVIGSASGDALGELLESSHIYKPKQLQSEYLW